MINRKEVIKVFSDATGEEITSPEHVTVTYRGKTYIVDIDANNAEDELASLTLADAVEIGRIERPRRSGQRSARAQLHSRVRKWAREHDIPVGTRGDVPDEVIERYLAATGKTGEDQAALATG